MGNYIDSNDSKLMIFNNAEFGEIRAIAINNEPWFVGKDICMFFGDTNHNRTLSRVDESDKQVINLKDSLGRNQKVIAVNESGLYSILFSMQPQKANKGGVSNAYPISVQERIDKLHRFKHWVTSEVLPQIRKTGSYNANNRGIVIQPENTSILPPAKKVGFYNVTKIWLNFVINFIFLEKHYTI